MKNNSPEKILTDGKSEIFQVPVKKTGTSVKTLTGKKGFVVPLIIAIVAIIAIGGEYYIMKSKGPCAYLHTGYRNTETGLCEDFGSCDRIPVKYVKDVNCLSSTTNPIIGGDKDEHGCLGPAGYSWCAVKNKCLRVWEEKCEVAPISTTTDPIACTMDAIQCPDGTYVGRTGTKCEFVCPTTTASCAKAGEVSSGFGPNPVTIQCCAGLTEIFDSNLRQYGTECIPTPGIGKICSSCGNNICENNWENKCNCPTDCK